jgi:hypothetical protein
LPKIKKMFLKRHPDWVLYHNVEKFQIATALAPQNILLASPRPVGSRYCL